MYLTQNLSNNFTLKHGLEKSKGSKHSQEGRKLRAGSSIQDSKLLSPIVDWVAQKKVTPVRRQNGCSEYTKDIGHSHGLMRIGFGASCLRPLYPISLQTPVGHLPL
jgi:hypothetical protein